jgi:hypothetical protein
MSKRVKIALGVTLGILALCGLGAALTGGDEPPAPANAASPVVTAKGAQPATTTPALTTAQRNAARAAENYLKVTGFSRAGLIKQLAFEGYSNADATLAVDSLKADWDAQAARSAENYLKVTGFSRAGLIKQLEFDGYTPGQAAHGADSVGL